MASAAGHALGGPVCVCLWKVRASLARVAAAATTTTPTASGSVFYVCPLTVSSRSVGELKTRFFRRLKEVVNFSSSWSPEKTSSE